MKFLDLDLNNPCCSCILICSNIQIQKSRRKREKNETRTMDNSCKHSLAKTWIQIKSQNQSVCCVCWLLLSTSELLFRKLGVFVCFSNYFYLFRKHSWNVTHLFSFRWRTSGHGGHYSFRNKHIFVHMACIACNNLHLKLWMQRTYFIFCHLYHSSKNFIWLLPRTMDHGRWNQSFFSNLQISFHVKCSTVNNNPIK